MADRSKDWFVQAERDLEQAKSSQKEARHEWACFAAQQSAEKAVKALHLFLKQEAWGHVVARLLNELPTTVSEDLLDKAKVLDVFQTGLI
jgi:HEPN domain-containing protein